MGAEAWGYLAVGQSFGAIGGVLVGFGWSVSGPASVAVRDQAERVRELLRSMAFRLVMLPPVGVAVAVFCYVDVPAVDRWGSAVLAFATASLGLSSSWYFVGTANPRRYILLETLPRAVGLGVGVLLIALGAPLVVLGLGVLAGSMFSVSLTLLVEAGVAFLPRSSFSQLGSVFGGQWGAAATAVLSTSYINLPSIVVSAVCPASLPAVAILDRLFRFANAGLSPVNQVVQGWIPHRDSSERWRRVRAALLGVMAFAMSAGLSFFIASFVAVPMLSGGEVRASFLLHAVFASVLAVTIMSQATGVGALMSMGQQGAVVISALLGALVGIPAIAGGAVAFGGVGGVGGELAAEVAVIGYQLLALVRLRGSRARLDAVEVA